jgi:glycosyltransferase involved in cell wall biosynthesis
VYLDFPHSSGILGKAAEFEKPIIVSNKYCMGERVSKYEIGLTVDENDTDALYQAICQLTTIQQQESNFNLRFDFATYRQVHSHSQLQQSFATLLSYS